MLSSKGTREKTSPVLGVRLPEKLTLADCDIAIRTELDDVNEIEGQFATGDAAADRTLVAEIRERIARGDEWAWAYVTVTVTPKALSGLEEMLELLSGRDTLGCCSYKDERDFRQPGSYFDDMCSNALADLNLKIGALREVL